MVTLLFFFQRHNRVSEIVVENIKELQEQVGNWKMLKGYWRCPKFDIKFFDIERNTSVSWPYWVTKAPTVILRKGEFIWWTYRWWVKTKEVVAEIRRLDALWK